MKEILRKHGIQAEQIEDKVYKVLNTDNLVSIDELQWELGDSLIVRSRAISHKKLPKMGGVNSVLAHTYYIITDYNAYDLAEKYRDKVDGEVIISEYREPLDNKEYIPTIYAPWEIASNESKNSDLKIEEIFKKHGIEAKEVAINTYEVLNPDHLVCIDELQLDLKSCFLISSETVEYKEVPGGKYNIAKVYYIVYDTSNSESAFKYLDVANSKFGEAIIEAFNLKS